MTNIDATLTLVALFALRIALPLIATLVFGYTMNRLLSRGDQVEPKI